MSRKTISFPAIEAAQLASRLNVGKAIYTTRVDAELDKYHVDDILSSRFGNLKVTKVDRLHSLNDHPFLNELSAKNKKDLGNSHMDLIKLTKQAGTHMKLTALTDTTLFIDSAVKLANTKTTAMGEGTKLLIGGALGVSSSINGGNSF